MVLPKLGQELGAYTIERELGRGGMGVVYSATHTGLGKRAAVKVLLPEASRDAEQVRHLFKEARAAAAIKHPSIVDVYDFGRTPDGAAYIVMELLAGESLGARLARTGQLAPATAVLFARQVAHALTAAHEAGIIHRDLKPENIYLVPDPEVEGGERVKLLDFGIAKVTTGGAVTATDVVMGTPMYMSPEQCEGARQVDARSDLYSLGCMLFEMIAGRAPFQAAGSGALIGMHLHTPAPLLGDVAPDAPAALESLVARLLAKSRADRYQTAAEVVVALRRLPASALKARPPRAARRSRLAFGLALGGLVLAGAGVATLLATGGGAETAPDPRSIDAPAAADVSVDGAIDAPTDAPPIDAPPPPTLAMWVAAAVPFVTLGSPPFEIQGTPVSREAYGWFLASLPAAEAAAMRPHQDWEPSPTSLAPVVWVTFDQASRFCAAIDAALPTSAQWSVLERSGRVTASLKEWTRPVKDGLAVVREPGVAKDYLRVPPVDPRKEIGFRCVR